MIKLCTIFLIVVALESAGQKTPAVSTTGKGIPAKALDSLSYDILFNTIRMIKVAEDPKKGPDFFMQDLKETNENGQPGYTAPYSVGGFNAIVRKEATNRGSGTTRWVWEADITSLSQGLTPDQLEKLNNRTDSLLKLLKYKEGKTVNMVESVHSRYYSFVKQPVVSIILTFYKPVYNSKAAASDSLLAIYKPILLNPAFAREAAKKLWGAYGVEDFTEPEVLPIFQNLVSELAPQKIESVYEIFMAVPAGRDHKNFDELMKLLTPSQKEAVGVLAKKVVDDYYEKQRKQFQGDPVVNQVQKKKELSGQSDCKGIPENVKFKFRKGLTMQHYDYDKTRIAVVTSFDCSMQKVLLIQYGSMDKTPIINITLTFTEFAKWERCPKQYYRCSHCAGEGGGLVTAYDTKVKELPFGYFSGIETKVSRTTSRTYWEACKYCTGSGWELLPDKAPYD
jgi:hypothetical protein